LPLLRKLPGCVPTIPILERICTKRSQGPLVTRRYTQVFSFHILAHSFALFCTFEKLNLFVFKRFRTLCQKSPGVEEGAHVSAHLNWLSFTSSDKIASLPKPFGKSTGQSRTHYE